MTKKQAAETAANDQPADLPQLNEAEVAEKIAKLRSHVHENFGKVVMAMMSQPRYRHQTLADLSHLVLEPLTVDRIAMAYARQPDNPAPDMAGMAIWASVSEEVDQKIREQIRAGIFPIRLKANEWISGEINWLLDVIAVDQKTTGSVIANFKQVAKTGDLRLHPIITRLVDKDTLEKIQSSQVADADA
ncbi:MAG: toxin-activating lysine-acyltransferase [Paracoccaceae bacterium]